MNYDFAIIGAGIAGLNLAKELTVEFPSSKILIIEKNLNFLPGVISFWSKEKFPFKDFSKVKVIFQRQTNVNYLANYKFYFFEVSEYKNRLLGSLISNPNIKVIQDKVIGLENDNPYKIICTNTSFEANKIFDSRIDSEQIISFQHFKVYKVDFNTETQRDFVFLDFPDLNSNNFFYQIPLNAKQLLVYIVKFGSKPDGDIDSYLKLKFSEEYKYNLIESNSIPLLKPRNLKPSNYIKIGSAAGLTRLSTGYGYTAIINDSAELKILKSNITRNKSLFIYNFLDWIFIKLMMNTQFKTGKFFRLIFEGNQFEEVLRFLDKEMSLMEVFRFMFRMKPIQLLRIILRPAS